MTDSAGRPGETEAVEAAHRATCHVPNCVARFDAEVAVDAAYPIIDEAVRAETADEVRALRAEVEQLQLIRFLPTGDNHHNARLCPYCTADRDNDREQARAARAELAAARDRLAAVVALHPKRHTVTGVAMVNGQLSRVLSEVDYCERCQIPEIQRWPCDTIAALSQSGQPTGGA